MKQRDSKKVEAKNERQIYEIEKREIKKGIEKKGKMYNKGIDRIREEI